MKLCVIAFYITAYHNNFTMQKTTTKNKEPCQPYHDTSMFPDPLTYQCSGVCDFRRIYDTLIFRATINENGKVKEVVFEPVFEPKPLIEDKDKDKKNNKKK